MEALINYLDNMIFNKLKKRSGQVGNIYSRVLFSVILVVI